MRALTTAPGTDYRTAYATLYELQGKYLLCDIACGFRKLIELEPEALGVVRKLSFPAKRGQPRMTAEQFVRFYPMGRFILKTANHVAAVVNGRLYDTWNSSRRCVYQAWEVAAAAPEAGGVVQ